MTTATGVPASEFIRGLTLPDGSEFGTAYGTDGWLEEVVELCLSEEHSQLWLELSRGHAKTSVAAAVALTECLAVPDTHCVCVAADEQQARILLEAASGLVSRDKRLAGAIRQTRSEFRFSNGSIIRVMSSDVGSFFGIGASATRTLLILDEIGQWVRRDLFAAAISTTGKHAGSRVICITNAGVRGSWQEGARLAVGQVGRLFVLPGCVASWVKPQLPQMEAILTPPEFSRYFLNEWSDEISGGIPLDLWDGCLDVALPGLTAEEPCVVALDAGVASDTFAMVACTRDPDPERRHNCVAVRKVAIFTPPAKGRLDFDGPRQDLTAFCEQYNVVEVAYDEYQLVVLMQDFYREHNVWCRAFSQQAPRAKADAALYQMLVEKRLRHDGRSAGLREAIGNVAWRMPKGEDTRARFEKASASRKIDAAVALSMASAEALRLNI